MSTPAEPYPLLERFKQRFFCADSMKWCISGAWCTDPLPTMGRISRTNDRERPQRAREQRPAERSRERVEKSSCAHPTVTKGTAERNSTQWSKARQSTRGKSVMSRRTHSTLGNTTNTAIPYPPLGQDEKSFSKSKSICVSTRRKIPWIRAIWTPPGGRKKGKVVFYQAQR